MRRLRISLTLAGYGLAGFWLCVLIVLHAEDVYARNRDGGDFLGTIWQPARDVLAGTSPYPDVSVASYVSESVYPPAIFLVSLPLAFVAAPVATVLWQVLLLLSAALTLVVLQVRDWRCHAIWLASCPVVLDVLYGNATLLVVLCAALLWRYRVTAWAAAVALAAGVAVKLILAPLWIWLLVTRRYRAAVVAALAVPLFLLAPWALIGFDGLRAYPEMLQDLARSLGVNGVLVHALAVQYGAGERTAFLISLVVAAVLSVLAVVARRDDLSSFTLLLAAALAFTPIGWIYYTGLLVVPLAARWPRLSWPWLGIAALWVSWVYSPWEFATAGLSAIVIAVCAAIVGIVVLRPQLGSIHAPSIPSKATAVGRSTLEPMPAAEPASS